MKTKIVVISVFIFLCKPVISQEIDNFLGVYAIQEICSSTTIQNFIDTTDYEIEIVESSRDTFDIQYYMFMHFQDTIRAIVLNENEFQIDLQIFPTGGGDYLSISGEGSVYNDSIEINYYSGGSIGGFNCNCKGRNKDATGLNDDNTLLPKILVYPNPTSNNLKILGETQDITRYQIFNLYGELICERKFTKPKSISISSLPKGIYFISLRNSKGQISTTRFRKF